MAHEMELLHSWFRDERFSQRGGIAGLELEAWLIDGSGEPTPWNDAVIARADTPDLVPELARYNVEFNVPPQPWHGPGLERLFVDLRGTWDRADAAAREIGTSVVAIGLLPTLRDSMLTAKSMSSQRRYHALNEQVLRLRQGQPIRLRLEGRESLISEHLDVMLEAATTSLQLHLQVPACESVRYFNAAQIASPAMVALSANSPLLFGKDLWDETRIPLFEQSVQLGPGFPDRVTFGRAYATESLESLFLENATHHPVLLPLALESASDRLAHVRLHNGTIWRWNRPLIGFDEDGTPHLRIEHRVMPAGPTLTDMAANAYFFYGLVEQLAHETTVPEHRLPFDTLRQDFYRAARIGSEAQVTWLDGRTHPMPRLILEQLLPRAAEGLDRIGVDASAAQKHLETIRARARSGQNGAAWQRAFLRTQGKDLPRLVQAYRELQVQGSPVHTWPVVSPAAGGGSRYVMRRSLLDVRESVPEGLESVSLRDLHQLVPRPTLVHLPGVRDDTLFVSLVLHGNEDVGLLAVQALLKKYRDRPLPRSLSLFIGNVDAARDGQRHLPGQPDYNRVWPGTDRDDSPEHAIMRHVMHEMESRPLFASIDLHNNTGWNPWYACVCQRDWPTLQLAALFSRTAVFFERPLGVQTRAFAEKIPAVTCECGKVGDREGVDRAIEFLDACLHLAALPNHAPAAGDLHLFHTIATLSVPERVRFRYGDGPPSMKESSIDLVLRSDLDRLNFQPWTPTTCIGWSPSPSTLPLVVTDDAGRNRTEDYLVLDRGQIRLRRDVIPSMLTCQEAVVRLDCLGYFMEPLPSQGVESSRDRRR
jgi:gamma-glutamyl:cysteine ligase YbdK (ATP-grasp superfamily)